MNFLRNIQFPKVDRNIRSIRLLCHQSHKGRFYELIPRPYPEFQHNHVPAMIQLQEILISLLSSSIGMIPRCTDHMDIH